MHLVDELVDLRDAEHQLTKALPKLAKSATSRALGAAFQRHLKETHRHIKRIDQALRGLGEKPKSKTCKAMQGLLEEGRDHMGEAPVGPLRDAVMITGAQKVEHYEMASYGTARTYARVLGEAEVARLLEQTLKEEKAADRTLTTIAKGSVNQSAAEEWTSKNGDHAKSRTGAAWAGATATAAYASRQLARGVRYAASAVGMSKDGRAERGESQRPSRTRGARAGRRRAVAARR
jgi:ferritin-like metal-binding protein YciE